MGGFRRIKRPVIEDKLYFSHIQIENICQSRNELVRGSGLALAVMSIVIDRKQTG